MANLEMRVYTAFDGVAWTVVWPNEQEYQLAKEFLKSIGAHVMSMHSNGGLLESEFVYIDNEEQLMKLAEFKQSLQQSRDSGT